MSRWEKVSRLEEQVSSRVGVIGKWGLPFGDPWALNFNFTIHVHERFPVYKHPYLRIPGRRGRSAPHKMAKKRKAPSSATADEAEGEEVNRSVNDSR
jgi:hypothetical protein